MTKPDDTIRTLADKAEAVADGLAANLREEGKELAGNVVEAVKLAEGRAVRHLKLIR